MPGVEPLLGPRHTRLAGAGAVACTSTTACGAATCGLRLAGRLTTSAAGRSRRRAAVVIERGPAPLIVCSWGAVAWHRLTGPSLSA